ncbi:DUF4199 domain-containing protein [Lewinellaceae bacterium SD302]|nr:DUF4199 domain-containing protein [Lewinellaceae bacterium SD302]
MLAKHRLEIKWGLIFSGMMLLWMVGEKVLGYHGDKIDQHMIITNFIAIPAFIIYYLALKDKRAQLGGYISWKEGFISGVIIAVVVMILSPLLQYLTSEVISPEYFPNSIEYAVESGNSTREEAEEFFNLRSYMMQATIGSLVMGTVTAAIMALVVRKKKGV